MEETPDRDFELDAIGQRCPLPVIRMARLATGLPAGSVVVVRTTDPAARHDLPAWARMRRHTVLSQTEVESAEDTRPDGPVLVTTIRLEAATGQGIGQREP